MAQTHAIIFLPRQMTCLDELAYLLYQFVGIETSRARQHIKTRVLRELYGNASCPEHILAHELYNRFIESINCADPECHDLRAWSSIYEFFHFSTTFHWTTFKDHFTPNVPSYNFPNSNDWNVDLLTEYFFMRLFWDNENIELQTIRICLGCLLLVEDETKNGIV